MFSFCSFSFFQNFLTILCFLQHFSMTSPNFRLKIFAVVALLLSLVVLIFSFLFCCYHIYTDSSRPTKLPRKKLQWRSLDILLYNSFLFVIFLFFQNFLTILSLLQHFSITSPNFRLKIFAVLAVLLTLLVLTFSVIFCCYHFHTDSSCPTKLPRKELRWRSLDILL